MKLLTELCRLSAMRRSPSPVPEVRSSSRLRSVSSRRVWLSLRRCLYFLIMELKGFAIELDVVGFMSRVRKCGWSSGVLTVQLTVQLTQGLDCVSGSLSGIKSEHVRSPRLESLA